MSKWPEDIVELRCKLYEAQHMEEVRREQARKRAENQTDITHKPAASTPTPANNNAGKTVTFKIGKP